jgi:acyl carrier protein
MTDRPSHIREAIEQSLYRIAPEADLAILDRAEPLRDQLDIDSFDFLRIVIELHEALGVDIPEADYEQLSTLNDMELYLTEAMRPTTAGRVEGHLE